MKYPYVSRHPSRYLKILAAALCASLAGACTTTTVRVVDMTPPKQSAAPLEEAQLLDVGIAIFDPNVPEDYDERIEQLVMPEVRQAEIQYIPYFLKNLLQSTGNWGAVRVIPRPTHAVDVVVDGTILRSDGSEMHLQTEVRDASGRVWFNRTYEALASKYAYEDTIPANVDAFQAIYKQISDDMLAYREQLPEGEIDNIRKLAELKFAQSFSAEAFADHVRERDDGGYEITRLPAEADPMLARVRQIREREYLFIDTLDEYYTNFYRQMYPTYQSYRKASYAQVIAYEELREQSRNRAIGGTLAIVGGVAGIYESDNGFVDAGGLVSIGAGATQIVSAIAKRHEAEMEAERLRELGTATEAELVPTTIELENQTARLQGNVEQQYEQLRGILRRVYFEDLNLPVPEDTAAVAAPTGDATTTLAAEPSDSTLNTPGPAKLDE